MKFSENVVYLLNTILKVLFLFYFIYLFLCARKLRSIEDNLQPFRLGCILLCLAYILWSLQFILESENSNEILIKKILIGLGSMYDFTPILLSEWMYRVGVQYYTIANRGQNIIPKTFMILLVCWCLLGVLIAPVEAIEYMNKLNKDGIVYKHSWNDVFLIFLIIWIVYQLIMLLLLIVYMRILSNYIKTKDEYLLVQRHSLEAIVNNEEEEEEEEQKEQKGEMKEKKGWKKNKEQIIDSHANAQGNNSLVFMQKYTNESREDSTPLFDMTIKDVQQQQYIINRLWYLLLAFVLYFITICIQVTMLAVYIVKGNSIYQAEWYLLVRGIIVDGILFTTLSYIIQIKER